MAICSRAEPISRRDLSSAPWENTGPERNAAISRGQCTFSVRSSCAAPLYGRTGKRIESDEHVQTAMSMYRQMDMGYWLEKVERNMKGPV